jgi:mRNA interferase MazF
LPVFEVVVVPFPFVDIATSKPRPTLVLSTRAFNEANGHTVLAMITTAARSHWPSDLPISDTEHAGLRAGSVIRWKVFTLTNSLIARRTGELSKPDENAAEKRLSSALGM